MDALHLDASDAVEANPKEAVKKDRSVAPATKNMAIAVRLKLDAMEPENCLFALDLEEFRMEHEHNLTFGEKTSFNVSESI